MDGGVERLLKDRGKGPRAGKKPISAEVRLAIVTRTAKEKPKHATHWSARMLAEEIGVGCGFRGNAATDSDGKRPPNPIESGHLIRTKAATLLTG